MTPEERARAIVEAISICDDPDLLGAECLLVENQIRAAIQEEREAAAKIIGTAQIFHCWGDTEIDGLDVQKRLANAILARKGS